MKFFELVTETGDLSKELNILINFSSAIAIIIIALFIHWTTLSWEVANEEQPNATPPPQSNVPVMSQSIVRETENPLRVHVSLYGFMTML